MTTKYLDKDGLTYLWGKVKTYVTNAVKVTGVKGNSESSYRTGNVNITAANVGAIPSNSSGNTQNLARPSKLNGLNDNTLDSKINTLRANRLAFLPADQIIIEKTTDGGTTWVDAGISDATKTGLFSETRAVVSLPLLNGVKSLLCGIRITFTAMKYNVPSGTAETAKYNYWNSNYIASTERYNQLKEMYFWVSTNSDTMGIKVQRATGAASTNWVTIFDDNSFLMTGWSGCDYLRFNQGVFGGGTTQTSNYWNYRITLMTKGTTASGGTTLATTSTTSAQSVMEIRAYGDTWWTAGNEYAANDKIYTHDYLKNVTFPAKVTATGGFSGALTGNVTGDVSGKVNNHTVNKDVPSNAVFTDTVTTATTSGSGNAVTAISASNGALTVTKGTTFLTSHQDISGKADKSATVSTVAWDSTNKKLTKTINGTTSDVVTAATLRTGLNVADGAEVNQNAFGKIAVANSTTIEADAKVDTLTLVAGNNVTISADATNDKVTISASTPSHTHGNIQNGGALQTTDVAIASGDKLVITDSSDSDKVARASLSFDGSTTTKFLSQKGTWETPSGGGGAVTGVKGNSESTYRTGDVNLTASNIGAAASSHAHGNITSGGDITATAPTIASGDQIIINDHSASKITNGPTFDGSTTSTALTPKGTFETFSKFGSSYFAIESKDLLTNKTMAAGNVQSDTKTFTKSGYIPLAIVGWEIDSGDINAARIRMHTRGDGTVTISWLLKNVGSASRTVNVSIDILWVSTSA